MDNISELRTSTNSSATASSRGRVLVVVESCLFLFLDITALLGNTLVCWAVYRTKSLQTITNLFVLSLAVSDILMAVLVMPLNVSSSIANRWLFGDIGINTDGYFGYCLAGTSLIILTLIAINRYMRVVRPSIYANVYTKKKAAIMIVFAWLLTVTLVGICFSVVGIEFRASSLNPTRSFPVSTSTKSSLLFSGMHTAYVTLPGLVIAVCYIKIYRTIHHHNAAVAPTLYGASSALQSVEEAKMTKLLAVVLIGFYLCWLPALVVGILNFFISFNHSSSIKYFNFYYTFPAFASSMINPVIYGVMSPRFRVEFVKILSRQ